MPQEIQEKFVREEIAMCPACQFTLVESEGDLCEFCEESRKRASGGR